MNPFRFKISLRFRHPSLDPDIISRELGLKPDRQWKSGENRLTLQGQPLPGVYPETYWMRRMASGFGMNMPEVLERELHTIENHKRFLIEFQSTGGSVEFYLGWFAESNSGGVIEWALMERLACLKIDLAVDFYGGPDQSKKEAREIEKEKEPTD